MTNIIYLILDKLDVKTFPRGIKRALMLVADTILIPIALWSAIALRYGDLNPPVNNYWWIFLLAPLLSIPILLRLGLYHAVVRFMGAHAMYAVLKGVTLSTLLLATIVLLSGVKGVPRSGFLIYWGVAVIYIGGSRLLMRSYFYALTRPANTQNIYAIYGAGKAGIQLYHALTHSQDAIIVAFIDDDKSLHGSVIHGIKVYAPSLLSTLITEYAISQILLAMPSVSKARRKAIFEELEGLPVHVRTIPGLEDLVNGNAKVSELREVDIEDLLGRDTVVPNEKLLEKCIKHKNILVTGAGGSIGSELCRQIIHLDPNCLVLHELSEYALYCIDNEIKELNKRNKKKIEVIPIIGNIQNQKHLETIFNTYDINTVYHAAAYKHVPLVEHNVLEAIKNNIFGTLNAALAAKNTKVETFVLISTDKAVRPTNVMGATKRFAEMILQGLAKDPISTGNDELYTHYCMVRFGNVLGSSGSVVPLFREQIWNGGPVTVTHPDIIRYFMTIPEAAQLVIQASSMSNIGEVFVLDMGEPVKIYELAKRMIHLTGFTIKNDSYPNGDIEIKFTGLRPGEKLYEELLIGNNVTGTQHPRIMQEEEPHLPFEQLSEKILELENSIEQYDIENIIKILANSISGFSKSNKISDYLWMAKNTEDTGYDIRSSDNVIELNDKLTTKEPK